MREIEVLRLSSRKELEEENAKRKFVTVKSRKKVSSSLRKDLLKNYGFKLSDN